MLLAKRHAARARDEDPVFPINYDRLGTAWDRARVFLGVSNNPLATLKALRRTAARHLTVNGMPAEMVRNYLRHGSIHTTLGYLKLTGGYSTNEQRRWL
jgi:integrase